jgi:transposase-like protein
MQNIADSKNISKTLKERQQRVLPIILSAKSIEAGCREAGISSTCFRDWLNEYPEFKQALEDGRSQLVTDAMQRLRQGIGKAVDKLLVLVDSENEEVSRKASTSIVEMALKLREDEEITERIESIEKIVLERRSYR